MALLFADGLAHYGTKANAALVYSGHDDRWSLNTGGVSRTGNACAFFNDFYGMTKQIAFANNIAIGSIAFMATSFPGISSDAGFQIGKGITNQTNPGVQVRVTMGSDGSFVVYRGINGTTELGRTAPNLWSPNAWVSVQFYIVVDPVNGYVELRVNGSNDVALKLENVNTMGQADTSIDSIQIGLCNQSNSTQLYACDFYICDETGTHDNDFVGDVRCRLVLTNANGPDQDWVATGEANAYDAINQVPPNPAVDYITASAAGNISDFAIQPVPDNTSFSAGFFAFVQSSKTDAGAANFNLSIISGASETDPLAINPGATAGYYFGAFPVDPATGTYWTKAALQAAMPKFDRTL